MSRPCAIIRSSSTSKTRIGREAYQFFTTCEALGSSCSGDTKSASGMSLSGAIAFTSDSFAVLGGVPVVGPSPMIGDAPVESARIQVMRGQHRGAERSRRPKRATHDDGQSGVGRRTPPDGSCC